MQCNGIHAAIPLSTCRELFIPFPMNHGQSQGKLLG